VVNVTAVLKCVERAASGIALDSGEGDDPKKVALPIRIPALRFRILTAQTVFDQNG
jgi:hypothetical protein